MLNFLIARLSASQTCERRTQLGFLHHNASHIIKSFASVVKSSDSNQPKQEQQGTESFTVSHLMNSCPKVPIKVSKRVHLNDPTNHDLVLNLLRSYGFSEIHICKLVSRYPRVLLARPEKTLLPKLRFFQSIGFSCSELPELFDTNYMLVSSSLKKCIIPHYEALKSLFDDDEKVNMVLKRSGLLFIRLNVKNVGRNIKVLRDHGVPESSVSLMLTKYTSIAFVDHAKFVESVEFVEETGIEPFKATFFSAIYVLSTMKKSTWESKMDIFERCGLSRYLTFIAFRKYPNCMLVSEEKITKSMKFLINEMCLPLKDIAECAPLLGYSLEKRIIPRWS